jgi:class 3 adenylate cyclase
VVLFHGPATAVRAALALPRGDARVGIAVAEVERDAETVRGYGVQLAADIADAAPTGEVWLSATVGVLLAGSTIAVETAGTIAQAGTEQPVLRPV